MLRTSLSPRVVNSSQFSLCAANAAAVSQYESDFRAFYGKNAERALDILYQLDADLGRPESDPKMIQAYLTQLEALEPNAPKQRIKNTAGNEAASDGPGSSKPLRGLPPQQVVKGGTDKPGSRNAIFNNFFEPKSLRKFGDMVNWPLYQHNKLNICHSLELLQMEAAGKKPDVAVVMGELFHLKHETVFGSPNSRYNPFPRELENFRRIENAIAQALNSGNEGDQKLFYRTLSKYCEALLTAVENPGDVICSDPSYEGLRNELNAIPYEEWELYCGEVKTPQLLANGQAYVKG